MGDTNVYEENRALFEELDREIKAAREAMQAEDMDAWVTHAVRSAELQTELAQRFGWRRRPASTEGGAR